MKLCTKNRAGHEVKLNIFNLNFFQPKVYAIIKRHSFYSMIVSYDWFLEAFHMLSCYLVVATSLEKNDFQEFIPTFKVAC